jgi:acyl carrier protein
MPTPEDIAQRVQRVICETFLVNEVQPAQSLVADLLADSLDAIELTMAFEDEFGVEISDDEEAACTTVGDCVDLVARKLGIAAGASDSEGGEAA